MLRQKTIKELTNRSTGAKLGEFPEFKAEARVLILAYRARANQFRVYHQKPGLPKKDLALPLRYPSS